MTGGRTGGIKKRIFLSADSAKTIHNESVVVQNVVCDELRHREKKKKKKGCESSCHACLDAV